MTEDTLAKAIEIKKQIDKLRGKEASLIDTRRLCQGYASDVNSRFFSTEIRDSTGRIKDCEISPETMRTALNMELENTKKEINILVEILGNMH